MKNVISLCWACVMVALPSPSSITNPRIDRLALFMYILPSLLAVAACQCDGDCPIVEKALATPAIRSATRETMPARWTPGSSCAVAPRTAPSSCTDRPTERRLGGRRNGKTKPAPARHSTVMFDPSSHACQTPPHRKAHAGNQETTRRGDEEQEDPGGCDRCAVARSLGARRPGQQGHFRAEHWPGQVHRASAEWARVL